MAAFDYIPLATSPSTDGSPAAEPPRLRRRIPLTSVPLPDLPYHQLARPRSLLLIPILLLPFLFHFGPRLGRSGHSALHPADNPYFHTGKIWEHNDEVATKLDRCAELGLLRNTSLPQERLSEREEAELIEQGCGTNETTVLVLASLWFAESYSGSSTAGEAIYAQSVISTLNANNYSYVFSSLGWYNSDMTKSVELWHKHRWNVRLVLADPDQVETCWNGEGEHKCLKTATNPEGIEAWRLLSLWYWDDPNNPLGAPFTLSPSPLNDNHFLTYSIEPTCRRLPFLPPPERAQPPQAYLLAKQTHYLQEGPKFSWSITFLSHLQRTLGVRIVAGMKDDDEETKIKYAAAGLTDFGRLGKIEFYEALAKSFVFVGVGQPRISPSPWDALCLGVPFVNPILEWDETDPDNRTSWHAQQWHMTGLDPPHVYHVKAHDLEGLRTAIKTALATPIGSFIPDYMKFDYACRRSAELIEGDWRGKAAAILEERTKSKDGRLFVL